MTDPDLIDVSVVNDCEKIRAAIPLLPGMASAVVALRSVLASIGWEARVFDLDLHANTATVEVHRADGRWVWVHADGLGRVTLERWQRSDRMVVYRGLPMSVPGDEFLGRTRAEGVRSGLVLGASWGPVREPNDASECWLPMEAVQP